MIQLVTCANSNYRHRIAPYLNSVEHCSTFDNVLVQIGDTWELDGLAHWRAVHLPRQLNNGAPGETESAQHGSFLQVLNGDPGDVIIFTDGDMIMQRALSDDELNWLYNFPAGTFSAGLNSGSHETLMVQATMINPRVNLAVLGTRFGDLLNRAMGWNIGVLVARRAAYWDMYRDYVRLWPEICGYFGHAARQQWLVNLLIAQNYKVQRMDYSFHANGHFGIPPGVEMRNGEAWYNGRLSVFRHKL